MSFTHRDELDHIKMIYTPQQIKSMWESCFPKIEKSNKKVIITSTPKSSKNEN